MNPDNLPTFGDGGMDDDELLAFLQQQEDEASSYQHGELARVRDEALQDYDRVGYEIDADREGQSLFVSSDVHDAVETILPDMLDVMHAGDLVCEFEARTEADEEGAKQATEACDYVYMTQNNGFVVSHTVIKDALQTRLGFAHWFADKCTKTDVVTLAGLSDDEFAYSVNTAQEEMASLGGRVDVIGYEVVQTDEGQSHTIRLRKTWDENRIRVVAKPADEVLVREDWSSPMLDECPYVCVLDRVTLSDLRRMGYEVEADDLGDSLSRNLTDASINHDPLRSGLNRQDVSNADPSQAEAWLRTEYFLADVDGDGIAERRRVRRLHSRILENDECSHVPVACVSPYLRQHRWDGASVWDHLKEMQRLNTDLIRSIHDGLSLAVAPRKVVQTDGQWNPVVNLDDLIDQRIGGIIRTKDMGAIREEATTWVGHQAMPFLEMVQGWKENRIGITRYNQGLDADSLNQTARGIMQIMSASQRRMKLIARIIAETLYKPMFRGVLKLLTEGDMPKIAAKVRGKYVEFDPSNWRSEYDVTINVGLGTGDKQANLQALNNLFLLMQQAAQFPSPDGVPLILPKHVSNIIAKIAENSGFKQPDQFVLDPESDEAKKIRGEIQNQPPPPPPLELELRRMDGEQKAQLEQMRASSDTERQQRDHAHQAHLEQLKASNAEQMARIEAESKAALARIQGEITLAIEQFKKGADYQMRRAELESRENENSKRTAEAQDQRISSGDS